MPRVAKAAMLSATACILLAACGGGGENVVSSPLPNIPESSPPDDTSVELLAPSVSQEFVVSTNDDPIRIRFDAAANRYYVKIADLDWLAIVDSPGRSDSPNRHFGLAGKSICENGLTTTAHYRDLPEFRYHYSNLLTWAGSEGDQSWGGYAAFGVATPSNGVPLAGSAIYEGRAEGQSDVPNESWGGSVDTTPVGGKVNLTFDFAAASLAGTLTLWSTCDCEKPVDIGPLEFVDTRFGRGSPTFSGRFASAAAGENSFDGHFTGPNAAELIGRWTVPFFLGGSEFQASGAWIAKR